MKKILIIIFAVIFIIAGVFANFGDKKEQQHKILSVDKIESVEGNSDGFSTRVYYQVSTDKGAFHIRTSGLNAAPQCTGIKKDSTYVLITRGISAPIIGIYPCIIEIKEEKK